ncbi:uncharacterized protein [Aristolochia californica]|uniref:uncharacterized protein n=1 Tax=Aristolochia californica TaxID=171875 RepID=UPI0035E3A84D
MRNHKEDKESNMYLVLPNQLDQSVCIAARFPPESTACRCKLHQLFALGRIYNQFSECTLHRRHTAFSKFCISCEGVTHLFLVTLQFNCIGSAHPVQIVQRHHFASHLKRMAVVVRVQEEFLAKGAPERIQDRLMDWPLSYVETYRNYTQTGISCSGSCI